MPSSLDENLLGQWARARLAHEAVMLEDAQQVLRQARNGVRGHASGASDPESESVIHIGDQVTHHHAAPPSGMSSLLKGAVAAGLLASGLGLPIGAWMMAGALKKPAEPITKIEKQIERWDSSVEMHVEPPRSGE